MEETLKKFLTHRVPLTEQEWQEFKKNVQVRHVKKGSFYLTPGQPCQVLGFVMKGVFRFYELHNDQEVTQGFVFKDSLIADYQAIIRNDVASSFVQAVSDCCILVIDYRHMEALFDRFHSWERLGRILSEETYLALLRHYQRLFYTDAKTRYLDLLEKEPEVLREIPLQHIASYLKISPQHLSRIRKELIS